MVIITLYCISLLSSIVWTIRISSLQNQKIIWEDEVRGCLPLWISWQKPQRIKKAWFAITDNTNQDLRKLLKKFNNPPYLGLKSEQVHNESTEDYFLLITQITSIFKIRRHVRLRTGGFKLGFNETFGHLKKNQSGKLESINIRTICDK